MSTETPEIIAPRSIEALAEMADEASRGGALAASGVNQTIIMAQSREVTAKKVAVPRSLASVYRELKVLCAMNGDHYVYSWQVKDRANQRTQTVEGGTIKLANDLLMLYGNASVDVDISETPTHWLFKAWFIDLERGVAYSRMFQQRKGQNTGMKDADRQADIVFQIGQSKAIRNVVLNALSTLAAFAVEESKQALLEKFSDPENVKKAHDFIDKVLDRHQISQKRVEAVVGRTRDKWTARDLARVYMEMRGIADGLTVPDEVYPSEEAAAAITAKKTQAKSDGGGKGTSPAEQGKNEPKLVDNAVEKTGAAQQQDSKPAAEKSPARDEDGVVSEGSEFGQQSGGMFDE
jgi:hypothetical protein